MLDFVIRCLIAFAAIISFYGLILLWIFWDQITQAINLRSKYGYSWAVAWDLAGTEIYVDKRLNAKGRNHAQRD